MTNLSVGTYYITAHTKFVTYYNEISKLSIYCYNFLQRLFCACEIVWKISRKSQNAWNMPDREKNAKNCPNMQKHMQMHMKIRSAYDTCTICRCYSRFDCEAITFFPRAACCDEMNIIFCHIAIGNFNWLHILRAIKTQFKLNHVRCIPMLLVVDNHCYKS